MKSNLILHLFFVFTFIFLFESCKKEDKRQYSKWYVNTDSFSTNDVKLDIGKVVSHIFTNSQYSGGTLPYGFSITFNTGSLNGGIPTSGSFKLDCSQQNPQWTCMSILYKDIGYLSNENELEYLIASQENGKAYYILEPTWFYNESNPKDSVLVKGTFNEP